MRSRAILGLIAILMLITGSCQKNDTSDAANLATTLSATLAEIVGNQICVASSAIEHSISVEKYDGHSQAYPISNLGTGNFGIPGYGISGIGHLKFKIPHIDSCATVTVSGSDYPREIVIEYTGDCNYHGKGIKKGKIKISVSDTLTNSGAEQTVTYEDFYIDSMKVELTATLDNLGKNESGHWIIERRYYQVITKNDDVCVRQSNETLEWLEGFETTSKSDDIYYLTGSGKVILNDTTYAKTIISPLLFDGNCEYIKSGVVELAKNNSIATIDYGDGTCDNTATVTIDGTTEEISLHSHRFREGGKFRHHCRGFGEKG